MVDLNDVALFVNVVRAGSFAEVGRRLGLPPSTASRRLQQLEQRLGVRLMQRSTRRLALTDAGRSFFAECAQQIDALTQSAEQLADDSESPTGKVRVAAPADFFNWFPIDLTARFLAEYPGVRLEFELNDARADLLGEGIDVAVRAGRVIEPTLIARQVGRSRAALVASPAYVAARGMPGSAQELSGHDCITQPARTGAPVVWRLDGPDGQTEHAVTGRFQANTAQAQLGAAIAGLGIALLPALMVASPLKAGALQEVLPGHGLDGIGVYLVHLSRRQLPRAVRAFTEFVVKTMLEQGLVNPAPPPK